VGSSVVPQLQKTLSDSKTVETLSQYFDKVLVDEVVTVMNYALLE